MYSPDHYSQHYSPSKRRKTSPSEYKCDNLPHQSFNSDNNSEYLKHKSEYHQQSENIDHKTSEKSYKKSTRKSNKSRKVSEGSNASSSSASVASNHKVKVN